MRIGRIGRLLLLALIGMPPRPVDVGVHAKVHPPDDAAPIDVHEDNRSAIIVIQDQQYNGRTKAIDIRLKVLRQSAATGLLKLVPIASALMLADLLTKQLLSTVFWRLVQTPILGARDLNSNSNLAQSRRP